MAGGAAAEGIKVVASFSILGDMVAQVAGERAEITTLVGPNGDAHAFEPSPADAKAVAEADIVFVNGLGLDGWMQRLAAATGAKVRIVEASAGVAPRTMEEDGHPATDAHAWQDLRNGVIYVQNIAAALIVIDPTGADAYRAAALAYVQGLEDLDREVRRQIEGVPKEKRKVITSHDAFGYFGAAYGVEFLAPEGINTATEPAARDVARLLDQIKANGIKALFIENIADPRMIEMIANETGAEPGGALYSDALSEPDGPAPHYVDMFRNNVAKLVAGMRRN
jgi:zinc/manganese transport system substrate-binding protein